MFKKGKLNIQEVEDKFELWKTRPEVIKANTNHKTEVDEMKLEWEKLRKDVMSKKNDEGKKTESGAKKIQINLWIIGRFLTFDYQFSTIQA